MKNQNFRFVPSLQIGFYDGKHNGDEPDLFLNSTQLSVAVQCDFIRFKKWSILLGTGTSFHHLRGLKEEGEYLVVLAQMNGAIVILQGSTLH